MPTVKKKWLKAKVLKVARQLLEDYRQDIDSGIDDGVYDEDDNEDNLKWIDDTEKLFDDFEKEK